MSNEGGGVPWKWIGVGCGVAALLATCAVGMCGTVCAGGIGAGLAATEAPASEVRTFFTDLKAGNETAAYAHVAPDVQKTFTADQLHAFATGSEALRSITDVTVSARQIQPPRAQMGGFLTTPSGLVPFASELVQGPTGWKLVTLSVHGQKIF